MKMQTHRVPISHRVNTGMAFLHNSTPAPSSVNTLEGGVPQIEINKGMATGNNIIDRYMDFEDFFLENEEDITPTPNYPKEAVVLKQPPDDSYGQKGPHLSAL